MDAHLLEAATLILTRAEIFHDSVRNELFKYFRSQKKQISRKAVYHLVMETTRRQNLLDEYLNFASGGKASKLDTFLINLLRIATYILKEEYYTSGKPPTIKEATKLMEEVTHPRQLSTTIEELIGYVVKIHKTKKEELFQDKTEAEHLALQYYHPLWFIEYMSLMLGKDEVLQLMQANNESKQVWLRINRLKEKRSISEITRELARAGVIIDVDSDFPDILRVKKARKSPVTTQLYRSKHIFAQDKTSSAIGHILDPQPHEITVDLACAPGMKFLHIASLIGSTGQLIGIDISGHRLRRMRRFLQPFIKPNIHLICADSRYPPIKKHIADRILLDAPCSSSGIFRMYPDHKWRETTIFEKFSQLQEEILENSLSILKKGGIGVYSVCSIHHKEGELIIEKNLPSLDLLPVSFGVPAYPHDDIGRPFLPEILKCRRTFPHIHNTSSFFICKFRKKLKIIRKFDKSQIFFF